MDAAPGEYADRRRERAVDGKAQARRLAREPGAESPGDVPAQSERLGEPVQREHESVAGPEHREQRDEVGPCGGPLAEEPRKEEREAAVAGLHDGGRAERHGDAHEVGQVERQDGNRGYDEGYGQVAAGVA